MKKAKSIISLILAGVMVCAQVLTVFAAPDTETAPLITGTVTSVEVVTDGNTGVTTVLVTVTDHMGVSQTVRVSAETATSLNLIFNDGEQYVIVEPLPASIEIKPETLISDEPQHPVGSALATFFSDDTAGMDYDALYAAIMRAHQDGNGFGLIAQALWLVRKLDGNTQDFELLLELKQGGNYSDVTWSDGTRVTLPDGTIPTNWGQFRKAVLGTDKKVNLGSLMLHRDEDAGNNQSNNENSNKDKNKDKSNNGRGRGNDNGNGNGNGNGNRP